VRSPGQLSDTAKNLCENLGFMDRFIMRYRPLICPFHILMERVPQGASVLDVGCGAGLWLFLLWRSGRISRGVGVDVRADRVELADSIKSDNDRLDFVRVGRRDRWPEGAFDCLTMIDVLHHIPPAEQEAFVNHIARTGAGRVIFKDIDPESRLKTLMNTLHDMVLSRQIPRYCRRDRVAGWLEEMGYRIIENRRCDMLWYSHYFIVAERTW